MRMPIRNFSISENRFKNRFNFLSSLTVNFCKCLILMARPKRFELLTPRFVVCFFRPETIAHFVSKDFARAVDPSNDTCLLISEKLCR
jgi:hypothetical protein